MNFLEWQKTDKNQFAVFIRDLSKNMNNVKHMIEDSIKKEEKPKYGKKNKKQIKKKKDIIIEEQTKIRLKKRIDEDLSKIDYLIDNLDTMDPYISFKHMKTEEGLLELKFQILIKLWKSKKENFPHIMNLYFQLIGKDKNKDHTTLLSTIESKLEDTEYKLYMMKNLSHLLPPLNIHEPKEKKLDDWQVKVVEYIREKKSVLVKAPTSSGKSFVGLSAGILHKKILYVCPAKPIAYQVGAHYSMMGYKVHYLLDNLCKNGYDDKTNIFVGIPNIIEDNLYKLGINYDYAVFDEIHNLNKEDDGHIYENIIKLIQCPFVALSATIGNIDYLVNLFSKIHNKKIHYVEYNKRFINHQKMIYQNGKLEKLHPLACIELNDLNDEFMKQNLQFTPYDSAILWETIEDVFELDRDYDDEFYEMLDECSPDNYFEDDSKILTLDDTREYEKFIKQKLVEMAHKKPTLTKDVLSKFNLQKSIIQPQNITKDIIELFKQCKQSECFPMLVFNTKTEECKKLFSKLFTEIAHSELNDYPYHYDILEKKDELYITYREKRQQYIESIKIGKTNDAQTEKQSKIERYDKNSERKYVNEVLTYYEACIHDCERNDIDDELKQRQLKNLKREMNYYKKYSSFNRVDIFQKHKDYCFTNSDPMTGDQIKIIRKEIQKTLGIKLPYTHELFQMLKRGIGIYTEDMPEEYKWILQKLMDQKKIGIVISDRTLCLGIDLPIRSSVLLGLPNSKEFTIDDYLQMSGRAGRRGKDDQGNTIFYNVNYKQLMKGILPVIRGSSKSIPSNYQCLNQDIKPILLNSINETKEIHINEYIPTKHPKLQWMLRYQWNVVEFINNMDKWNKKIYSVTHENDKEIIIMNSIIDLLEFDEIIINDYKKKIITSHCKNFRDVCNVLETIYNYLRDKKYNYLKEYIKKVYVTIKDMILKYQGLN